jgi:cytochrome c1
MALAVIRSEAELRSLEAASFTPRMLSQPARSIDRKALPGHDRREYDTRGGGNTPIWLWGCHTIPGIPGGDGKVGGPLADIRQRVYVGGVLTNTPNNLIQWIVSPQVFSPRSAMPATGISEPEARDIAAYLYSR